MEHRYVEASEEAIQKTEETKKQYFPQLENAIIKILFDTKMRKKGDKIILGSIMVATPLIRRLTDTLAEEGCDYIMFLDQVVFENIPDDDKIRLIRHELRHCKVIVKESGEIIYGVIPHDIEDFVIEIELNKDKVNWANNAGALAKEIYDQMKERSKEEKETKNQKPIGIRIRR